MCLPGELHVHSLGQAVPLDGVAEGVEVVGAAPLHLHHLQLVAGLGPRPHLLGLGLGCRIQTVARSRPAGRRLNRMR